MWMVVGWRGLEWMDDSVGEGGREGGREGGSEGVSE